MWLGGQDIRIMVGGLGGMLARDGIQVGKCKSWHCRLLRASKQAKQQGLQLQCAVPARRSQQLLKTLVIAFGAKAQCSKRVSKLVARCFSEW